MEHRDRKKIELSLIQYPLFVLGPGKRVGIWVQGCSRRCNGCMSPHTWNRGAGEIEYIDELVYEIKEYIKDGAEGVTISGGEPMEQSEALKELLYQLNCEGIEDILLYTGMKIEEVKEKEPEVLNYLAAIIDGEFIKGEESKYIWKGSENQRMLILSDNKNLIDKYEFYSALTGTRRLQVAEKEEKVFIVGIPEQKDDFNSNKF